jgi:hypothetical protein
MSRLWVIMMAAVAGLLCLPPAARSQDAALFTVAVQVSARKANGQPWDADGSAPEIRMYVVTPGGTLPVRGGCSSLTCTFQNVFLPAGATVRLMDEDMMSPDLIGAGTCPTSSTTSTECRIGQAMLVLTPATQPGPPPPTQPAVACGPRQDGPAVGASTPIFFVRQGEPVGSARLIFEQRAAGFLVQVAATGGRPTNLFEAEDEGVGPPSIAWHNRSDGSVVIVVAGASTRSELGLFLVNIENGSIVVGERWRGLYGDAEPVWSCSTRPR